MTNTFTGNVGEVSLKFTPSGKAVCEISFAENFNKKDQNGQWQEDGPPTWRRATLWEDKAEAAADFIKKGDRIIVVGRERLREWEAKDGTKGKSLEVQAQSVAKIPPRLNSGTNNSGFNTASASNGGQQDPWAGSQQAAGDWGTPQANESPF